MPTSNETIRDGLIRHQIELQRLGAGLSQELVGILDDTEDEIVREIERALKRGATTAGSAGLRKLELLEDAVRTIRKDALATAAGNMRDSSEDLVRHEAEFSATLIDDALPVVMDLTLPSPKSLRALVDSPVEGLDIDTWFDRIGDNDAQRVMDRVRVGVTKGDSIDDIVRSVVGTVDTDGRTGTTQLTRNYVDSLVRTMVNDYSNKARALTFAENKDIITEEVYTATLDGRTSHICRALDGERFPVGEGKFPPQHFRCRSIRVAVIGRDLVGERPMKPTTERMLVSEWNDLNGTKARIRDDLPRGQKGDFDEYARGRVRELVGTVPAKTTYQDFLSRQSAAFQDDVLGKAKAKLFRDGDVKLDKFVARDGSEVTLAQLAERNRAAFKRAGLDPDKYKVE